METKEWPIGRLFSESLVDEGLLDGSHTFLILLISSPPIVQVRRRDCIAFEIGIRLP